MNKNFAVLCVISLLFLGCNGLKTNESNEKESFYSIRLEDCLKDITSMKLSEIADTIEYIELKTPRDIVVFATEVELSEDYIFVSAKNEYLFQFSMDGNFIRQIGNKGQGPGEYAFISSFFVDESKKKIGIASSLKLLFYSFDGLYLNTSTFGLFTDIVAKDTFLYASYSPRGRETYRLVISNQNQALDTVGGIPNYDQFYPGNKYIYVSTTLQAPFYKYQNELFFNGYNDNDTVWKLKGAQYEVYTAIDMGKYKSPIYKDNDTFFEKSDRKEGNFYAVNRVAEDDHYLYLSCIPYWNPEMLSPRVVFDKEQNAGFTTKTQSGEYGIEDDIMNGPTFWPLIITEDYYVSLIEPDKLIDQSLNQPDIKPAYKKFLKNIREDSNSIVILAKRKK